jgi:hypothetical protein
MTAASPAKQRQVDSQCLFAVQSLTSRFCETGAMVPSPVGPRKGQWDPSSADIFGLSMRIRQNTVRTRDHRVEAELADLRVRPIRSRSLRAWGSAG